MADWMVQQTPKVGSRAVSWDAWIHSVWLRAGSKEQLTGKVALRAGPMGLMTLKERYLAVSSGLQWLLGSCLAGQMVLPKMRDSQTALRMAGLKH